VRDGEDGGAGRQARGHGGGRLLPVPDQAGRRVRDRDPQGLTITLTETASECGYRAAKLAHAQMNELRIKVNKKGDAPIAVGELAASEIEFESGEACIAPDPDEERFGSIGTAFGAGTARGKVTITAKTEASIEGTIDVRDWQGKKTTFTFTAPICGAAPAEDEGTCCAGATPPSDE